MLERQLILGTSMILINVAFHIAVFMYLIRGLEILERKTKQWDKPLQAAGMLSSAVLAIIATHTAEAVAWAVLYRQIGELHSLSEALYFSVVTSTTLGYGDLTLSPSWQLLGTFEAMGGLILFGVSTAFLMKLMEHLFRDFLPRTDM